MGKYKSNGYKKCVYVFIQLIGLCFIMLMIIWTQLYLGGFRDINNPKIEFNWHPLLMIISMVFLYGNSIFIYRNLRENRNKMNIFFHGVTHSLAFILFAIALQAVYNSHNFSQSINLNLYSLHSWIGLGSVVLFICQWIGGFLSFLYPNINDNDNKYSVLPLDIFISLLGFVLAISSALIGLTEKAFISIKYSTLPNSGRIVNIIGILIICFGCLIIHLYFRAYKCNYNRRKSLDENIELLANSIE